MKIKHQKLKSAGAFLTILLLLPYVVTVFVNGIDVLGMSQEPCVQAETEDQNTADPVDGEFKKVDEEIIPGEYRRVEELSRTEHEQMTSSYTYGGTKEEPKTDDKPSAEE